MKVYAIITAYNPIIENLKKSIERLSKEVTEIIICNNSSANLEFEKENLTILNFNDNLGIAKAQNIGMKKAFDEYGADFIVQFDQDSLADENMVTNLISYYNKKYEEGILAIIGPQDYDKDTLKQENLKFFNKKIMKKDIYEVDTIISSGCLISKEVYKKNGGMKEEWFIDIVDFEYCWRAKKSGIRILKYSEVGLAHKLGDGKIKTKLGFKVNIGSPIRHYYQLRNILFAMKLDYVPLKWKLISFIKITFKLLFYKLILEDGKIRYEYMKLGIQDFLKNKTGKISVINEMKINKNIIRYMNKKGMR